MLFKLDTDKSVNIYVLNNQMLDVFVGGTVSITELPKLITYHDKLSSNEIGNILRLQSVAAKKITNKELSSDNLLASLKDKLTKSLIKDTFNRSDSIGLLKQINECSSFYVKGIGCDNYVLLLNVDNVKVSVDWSELTSKKFSTALLETIYKKVGYLDVHFRTVPKNVTGDFSLSDVYKLINIELK